MALTYSTGTASVTAGGTSVVGSGSIWTGGNVSVDDDFIIDGVPAKVIEIVDATHLIITPWLGSTKSGASYVVRQNSSRRFDDVQIADDLRAQVAAQNAQGYPVIVPDNATEPDPSLGNELQPAIQFNSWKWWKKEGGLWNFKGSPAGLLPANALSEIAAAGKQAAARTNLGATTVGSNVFTATDQAAGRAAINAQVAGSYQSSLGFTPANKAGDTFTGQIRVTSGGILNDSLQYVTVGKFGPNQGDISFEYSAGQPGKVVIRVIGWGGGATKYFVFDANGDLTLPGAVTAGIKPFLIDHPTQPLEKDLVFVATEAPFAGVEFWGIAKLVDGQAIVDIDAACNLSPGTFAALTQRGFVDGLNNLDSFALVRAGRISGGHFTIHAADPTCADEVAWHVHAERDDPFVKTMRYCDPTTGRLIPEHDKPDYTEAAV